MLELYRNIRKYRKEAHMSQDELAKKVGYTDRSSIAKIENGDVDLPQSKIMAIAKALDVSAGTLMGWEDVSDDAVAAVMNLPMVAAQNQELKKYFDQLNDEDKVRAISLVRDLSEAPASTAASVSSIDPRKNRIDHYYPQLSEKRKDELLKRCEEYLLLDQIESGERDVSLRSFSDSDAEGTA